MLPGSLLALSIAGLRTAQATPWRGERGPRAVIEWVARLGYRSIQLDAALPGLRPRELDRSARRGVASLLRQRRLSLSGLDLWIPPEHFADPSRQGRALDAVEAAVMLAADLRAPGEAPSLSLELTSDAVQAMARITELADRHGVRLAVHGSGVVSHMDESPVGTGIDPAGVICAGGDAPSQVAMAGRGLVSARLSDADGRRRVNPGLGQLDLVAYAAALSVAGYLRPIVVDLRELEAPEQVAAAILTTWPPI